MKSFKLTVLSALQKSTLALAIGAGLSFCPILGQAQENADADAAEPTQNSALTGEWLYEILLGEMSLREGSWNDAFTLLLDTARKSGDYALYARAVDIALQARSGDAAVMACKAWSDAFPQDRKANEQLLQIYTAVNKLNEAAVPLQKLVSLAPANERADVILTLPRYFARVSDKTLASQLVSQALTPYLDTPDAASAYSTIGRLRLMSEDLPGALQAAQKAHQADRSAIFPALLALELMTKGVEQANAIVEDALKEQKTTELALSYARVLIELNRLPEATTQLRLVTQQNPQQAEAWLVLGSVQYEMNDDANAEQSLLRYVQLTQNSPQVSTGKGLLQAQARRAAIAARQGHPDKAMTLLDGLSSADPQDQQHILATKVQLLREQKQWQQAYNLIEQSHTDDLDLLYEQAMLAERLNQLEPMERLLRRIIARDPKYYNAYNALGFSLADRGLRLKEARELIAKAVKLAPQDPFIADSLGWVEFKLGNMAASLVLLEKAYADKADPEIGAHLGEVLWKLNRHDEAKKIWREAQQAAPENETLKNTLDRIKPTW